MVEVKFSFRVEGSGTLIGRFEVVIKPKDKEFKIEFDNSSENSEGVPPLSILSALLRYVKIYLLKNFNKPMGSMSEFVGRAFDPKLNYYIGTKRSNTNERYYRCISVGKPGDRNTRRIEFEYNRKNYYVVAIFERDGSTRLSCRKVEEFDTYPAIRDY